MTNDRGVTERGDELAVDGEATGTLDAAAARALGVMPLELTGGKLQVAAARPSDQALLRSVELLSGRSAHLVGASAEAIARAQERAYGSVGASTPDGHGSKTRSPSEPAPTQPGGREPYRALARELDLPFVSLEPHRNAAGTLVERVDTKAAQLLTSQACRTLGLIPIATTGASVAIATAEPERRGNLEAAAVLAGLRAWVVVASAGGHRKGDPQDVRERTRATATAARRGGFARS